MGTGLFPCRRLTLDEITYRKANAPAPGQDLAGYPEAWELACPDKGSTKGLRSKGKEPS